MRFAIGKAEDAAHRSHFLSEAATGEANGQRGVNGRRTREIPGVPTCEDGEKRRQRLTGNHVSQAHDFQTGCSDPVESALFLRRRETQDKPSVVGEMRNRSPRVIAHVATQFESRVGFLRVLRKHARTWRKVRRAAGDERKHPAKRQLAQITV